MLLATSNSCLAILQRHLPLNAAPAQLGGHMYKDGPEQGPAPGAVLVWQQVGNEQAEQLGRAGSPPPAVLGHAAGCLVPCWGRARVRVKHRCARQVTSVLAELDGYGMKLKRCQVGHAQAWLAKSQQLA